MSHFFSTPLSRVEDIIKIPMGASAAILKQRSDDRAGGWQCEPASAMVPRFRFCCQQSYRGEGSQGPGLLIILRKSSVNLPSKPKNACNIHNSEFACKKSDSIIN